MLAQTDAFGYQLWVEDHTPAYCGYDRDLFGEKQEVTLRIQNFLDPAKDVAFNEKRANMSVSAKVFIKLSSGEMIETDAVSYTFRVVFELAVGSYESYSPSQQAALTKLREEFPDIFLA